MEFVLKIAIASWDTLCEMAPYLLFGFLTAGLLSIFISPALVEKHLGGHGIWPVFKASLFGVPLPLCSCGVIPVATSLRKHGSSKGATIAFLLSTPQTGVDSILATFSLLGPVFAVFRPLAAFVSGLLGGTIVDLTEKADTDIPQAEQCPDSCCSHHNNDSKILKALRHGFVVLPKDIAKPLCIGLLLAGAISSLVPDSFFADKLGTGLIAMLVMMALGIPVYVCATASIPIAVAMILKGITPGAALVFLMTGPATNMASIATLWKIMGKKTTLIYLMVVAFTAIASGLLLDLFIGTNEIPLGTMESKMLPHNLKVFSAILLIIILAPTFIPKRKKKEP